jgi:hypothetical protein
MALRLLLVGFVASLGCEWPSGGELTSWARDGREWVGARLADLGSVRAERGLACSIPADRGQAGDSSATLGGRDLAFDVVVEGMAADFAVDLAATRAEDARWEPAPDAIVGGGPAFDPIALAWTDPEPALIDGDATPATIEEPASRAMLRARPARVERLSSAIRLTRQAYQAWALLIRETPRAFAVAR